MKNHKIRLTGLYAVILSFLWAGCSYDREISDPHQYSAIYIPQAFDGAISTQLIIKEEEDEFLLGAAFGGIEHLESDAKVTFRIANELIDDYNDNNNTSHLQMPERSYALSGAEVTLRKGTSTSDVLKLKVKTLGHLEKGKTYLLPITISDVSVDIPVNTALKTVYYIIEPISKYQNSTIYIPQAANGPVISQLSLREEDDEFPLQVNFGGSIDLEADANVTLRVANNLIDDYNLSNNTTYLQMPNGSYELSETEVTIKKGTTASELVQLKVKTFGQLEIGKTYILPISIANVSLDIPIDPASQTIYYIIEIAEYAPINRASWVIHDISGDENEYARGGRGLHSIDGDVNTIWSTPWRDASLVHPPPYFIVYDMGKQETLYGAKLMVRRANNGAAIVYNVNGTYTSVPKGITIEISDDATNWSTVKTTDMPIQLETEVFFDRAERGRYIKLTITSLHAAGNQATLAEFNAF